MLSLSTNDVQEINRVAMKGKVVRFTSFGYEFTCNSHQSNFMPSRKCYIPTTKESKQREAKANSTSAYKLITMLPLPYSKRTLVVYLSPLLDLLSSTSIPLCLMLCVILLSCLCQGLCITYVN